MKQHANNIVTDVMERFAKRIILRHNRRINSNSMYCNRLISIDTVDLHLRVADFNWESKIRNIVFSICAYYIKI